MNNPTAWRHINNPHSKIDRVSLQDGKYVRVMKDGTILPVISQELAQKNIDDGYLVPCKDEPFTKDDEIALSMLVFIEQYGARMIEATAKACEMAAKDHRETPGGFSRVAWGKVAKAIREASRAFEEPIPEGCPGCGGITGCWCDDQQLADSIRTNGRARLPAQK